MFDKYGEFDSVEELNKAAEGQKNQGDLEALISLAEENGLDKDDAQDYMDGYAPTLATPLMAAYGKLDLECKEINAKEIVMDWVTYIRVRCQESEDVARAVRKKGKSLKECIAELLKWSFKNAYDVDKDIIKAAGISAGKVQMGIPGMARAYEIIDKYYLGE